MSFQSLPTTSTPSLTDYSFSWFYLESAFYFYKLALVQNDIRAWEDYWGSRGNMVADVFYQAWWCQP
eukprot:5997284-Karenia_brevis.AAC.1